MPGLYGIIKYSKLCNNSMIPDQDLRVSNLPIIEFESGRYIIKAAKNSRNISSYKKSNILVIFEGFIIGKKNTKLEIAKYIHKRYVNKKEKFIKELRGFFQIIIIDDHELERKIFIYSDYIASRHIYYTIRNKHLFFSPDVESLINNIDRKTADEMAMVNFLVSGHFPAGHTAINEVKVIGPGEYLCVENDDIQKRNYFKFNIEPDEMIDRIDASRELDIVLNDKIIEYWKSAEEPAILLSGGYDSQYIFYTIAQSVEDTSKLRTVTWGENPNKRYADMDIARRTANRFGTQHIEIVKKLDKWQSEYDKMFIAQSGMTDSSFYHANELSVCKKLFDDWGIRSIIRGDECFGYGPDVDNAQDALKTNSMSFPEYIKGMDNWFINQNSIIEKYSSFMRELVDKYQCQSYNSLKDTLDFYERQYMNRNPLNYYKLHYLDVFCPFIDPDVLEIICKLPERYRHHKNLFKTILEEKISDELQIADYTNLTNWEKVIGDSNEIKQFFFDELKNLPGFLNYNFFYNNITSIISGKRKNINAKIRELMRPLKKNKAVKNLYRALGNSYSNKDQLIHIPIHFLIIRATVLSRWNKLWIKSNLS